MTDAEKEAKQKPDGETPVSVKAEAQRENSSDKPPEPPTKEDIKKQPEGVKKAAVNPIAVPVGPVEYILDKKIYYMRESLYRQKMQQRAANKVKAMMPSVPK